MDPDKFARLDAAVASIGKRVDSLVQSRIQARADSFDEGKHPRASDGKFGSGGGGRIHPSARKHPTNTHAPMKRKAGEDINSYMSRAIQERDARKSAAANPQPSWRR